MDYYSNHGSPNRYGSDGYRRSSPGYTERRSRVRSKSPYSIDRYQPTERSRDRDSHRDRDRERDRDYRDTRDSRDRERDRDRDRDIFYKRRDEPVRRRSPVAPNIDRYVPGQEPSAPPPAITTNPMPNPNSLDMPVGFTYFAEWWRLEQQVLDERDRQKYGAIRPERLKEREERGKDREQIQAAYDAYKERYHLQVLKNFIQQHKNEEWFKEKYDPAARQATAESLAAVRHESYFRWTEDLDSGVFDNFTLEGLPKNEANATQSTIDREEGETSGGNEVLAVSDLISLPGCDIRDPALQYPTLLIKTIAPTVSRAKMEEFCKTHLGSGEGGYKWLSLSDPNPLKKYHRIGWVVLNGSSGNVQDEDEDDGMVQEDTATTRALEALNGKTVYDETRGDFTCHVGIHEPPTAPRKKALWDLFSSPARIERDLELASRLAAKLDATLGSEYSGLAKIESKVDELRSMGLLKSPHSSRSQDATMNDSPHNAGEDNEDEEGQCEDEEDDEELLAQKKKLDLIVEYLRRVFNFCFFCVFESDSVHELTRKCPGGHLRRPKSCLSSTAKVVAIASAQGEPFPLKKHDPTASQSEDAEAPNSATTAEDSQQSGFMKPSAKTQQQLQRAYNWVKNYEDRLLQVLEPENVDLRRLGGRPLEEALEEDLARYVKQEDEAKFRCKLPECTKLFKAEHFWRKHVEKRHDEFFLSIKRDIETTNAYVLDPGHLAPPYVRPDMSATHPHLSQTPGFSPRSNNMASFSPGLGMIPNFSAMFANGHGSGGRDGALGGGNRAGPIRNRNTRHSLGAHGRPAGPYSRPDGFDGRRSLGAGGLGGGLGANGAGILGGSLMRASPARGGDRRYVGGGASGGGGGIDGQAGGVGAGGSGVGGSRDAIQGRSLKSYEDLDAAGPGGGDNAGQLDY